MHVIARLHGQRVSAAPVRALLLKRLVHVPILEDLLRGNAAGNAASVVPGQVVHVVVRGAVEVVFGAQGLHVRLSPLRHHGVDAHLQSLHRFATHCHSSA